MVRAAPLIAVAALAFAAPATGQGAAAVLVAEPAHGAPSSPTAAATYEYLYDDGAGNVNIGPPSTFDPDMLWGNYFFVDPVGTMVTQISVAFGPTFPSSTTGPVTFWLLGDPDGDGDPRTNAQLLGSVDATPDVFGNTFFHVPITPAEVPAGFFVGVSAQLLGGQDRPARVDTDGRADRSWFFYAPDIAAVIDSLAGAPFGTRMDDASNVPFPGAFMIRALGETTDATGEGPTHGPDLSAAPNPVGRATAFRFTLPSPGHVALEVFDTMGRRVARLAAGDRSAGAHEVHWETREVAHGVYMARLVAGSESRTIRLVVSP